MPVYSQAYDSRRFDPAMPVTEAALFGAAAGPPVLLTAIVDTGADATLLPIDLLTAAGARYSGTRQMRGITGQAVTVDAYTITLQLGPHIVHGLEAIAMPEGSEPIIGRDVLNELEITLNGPAQELWIA